MTKKRRSRGVRRKGESGMEESQKLICNLCDAELVPMNAGFSYLGHSFRAEVPRCPVCGQIYLSEGIVKERIVQVEMDLEDK